MIFFRILDVDILCMCEDDGERMVVVGGVFVFVSDGGGG